jgi:hypothetical protein
MDDRTPKDDDYATHIGYDLIMMKMKKELTILRDGHILRINGSNIPASIKSQSQVPRSLQNHSKGEFGGRYGRLEANKALNKGPDSGTH